MKASIGRELSRQPAATAVERLSAERERVGAFGTGRHSEDSGAAARLPAPPGRALLRLHSGGATELARFARICRVTRVMQPFLDAIA